MTAAWRRWLRLGPSRAELMAEVQQWKSRTERSEKATLAACLRAKNAEERLREAEQQVLDLQGLLHDRFTEPTRADGCDKIRFHNKTEADDFGAAVAQRSGEDPSVYYTYGCKICPRSPVTMLRYWHVGHPARKKAQQSKEAAKQRRADQQRQARRAGNQIVQRLDPEVAERLRALRDAAVEVAGE